VNGEKLFFIHFCLVGHLAKVVHHPTLFDLASFNELIIIGTPRFLQERMRPTLPTL